MAAAVKPVETARAKALPLREAVREKEQIVLAARKTMARSRIALEHHKKRLRLLEAYTQRIELEGQAAAAVESVRNKREAVLRSQTLVNEYAAILALRKEERNTTDQARLVAERAMRGAQAALERHQKIEKSVVEAYNATDAARQQLPDDSTLTEASEKLKAKAGELRSVSVSLRSKSMSPRRI